MFPSSLLRKRSRGELAVVEPDRRPPTSETTGLAAEDARGRGAVVHVIEGSELVGKRTTLDAIAAELSFPEWSGRDLDALYDCLTDLSWLTEGEHVLIWSNHRVLAECAPKAYRGITAVLCDAAADTPDEIDPHRSFSIVYCPV